MSDLLRHFREHLHMQSGPDAKATETWGAQGQISWQKPNFPAGAVWENLVSSGLCLEGVPLFQSLV